MSEPSSGGGQPAAGQVQGRALGQEIDQATDQTIDLAEVVAHLRQWATELGFSQIGVADVDLSSAEAPFQSWLARGFHGEMHYMASHGLKRARPAELVPGTVRVITARMDYLPATVPDGWQRIEWDRLARPGAATVSMYARGRDYHKVLRARLQKLADRLAQHIGPFGHRVFTDSAPVMEVELASRSGLGWRGKHTLLLSRQAGSAFFLGEIYIDVALPLTAPESAHCGSCRACLDVCPTQAIVGERLVDARRCISYLTIELGGPIPTDLRPLMGNRLYGCDDCQLVCPWNKFAGRAVVPDFDVRAALRDPDLLDLWRWDEPTFLRLTEGSPIRRIGFARWQRNLAVAMGNTLAGRLLPIVHSGMPGERSPARAGDAARRALRDDVRDDLREALLHWQASPPPTLDDAARALVAEHVAWALAQAEAQPV